MRRRDTGELDPEIEACLDAIDATLAGEPVHPRHAELAELALLLADECPRPSAAFTRALDSRAQRRFPPDPGSTGRPLGGAWGLSALGGSLAAACLAAVVGVVLLAGGGSGPPPSAQASHPASSSAARSASGASGAASTSSTPGPASTSSTPGPTSAPSAAGSARPGAPSSGSIRSLASPRSRAAAAAPSSASASASLQPPANGRKVIQSAELDLASAPDRIDEVAQEVFAVAGRHGAIVDHSTVTQTGGPDGTASFWLRIPTASLGPALAQLSALHDATVLARTDTSQDVNQQSISLTRALADAQALRTSLLRQLAHAVTTAQIDSLEAQIRDNENAIASDTAQLRALNAQIDYSQVTVTLSARSAPVPVSHGGAFTLHHAAHVAARVLVVAAGVGLIALAGLVPVGLVVALALWLASGVRRRRREQALDLA